MKNRKLYKQVLKGWGYLLFAEMLSLIVITFTGNFFTNVFLKFIIALCPLTIIVGLLCNYAHNIAKHDIIKERNLGTQHSNLKPLILGFTTSVPLFIMWIILLISKLGLIGNFLVAYKVLNAFFLPIIDFIHHGTNVADVSFGAMIIILLLTFIPMLSVYIAYNLTYQNREDKDFSHLEK